MTKHIDDTQLNDYLEGLVTEDVARAVEEHLTACEECSRRLEALTLLLSDLAGLPGDATPTRDLWSGIRAGIEGLGHGGGLGHGELENQETVADKDVAIPIWRGRSPGARRFSFSATQLLAASVVWALLSGGTVWMALTTGPDEEVVAATDITPVGGLGRTLPAMQVATTEYEQAIASLESILELGRDRLDPQTVATIEANLGIIDRAIGEALRALADDPNNPALNRLLIKHEQSKLRVLRQASAAVQI